ncbi:MAG TPA: dihydroorotate dehydrogenase electron transfer subunit [Bacillales bacterium]|nr:dihydroorotate dehydrogenase electron transfer subunit [Bacillales bacterium]
MKISEVRVTGQREIANRIYELKLHGEVVDEMTNPGQFVHLRTDGSFETLLRRPISIADVDRNKQEVTIIYRVEGAGTSNLAAKRPGDVVDLLGPLGNGFPLGPAEQHCKVLLVGGGIGVPPLYYLSRQLKSRGVEVKHVLGFSSKAEVFYEEKFSELGETFVTTVDGSHGLKGFVTDAITKYGLDYDLLYACGPTPMLKALEQASEGKEAYLSLEQRMGCAVGACLACVVHVQGDKTGADYRKVCKDGPVFPAGEVVL